MSDEIQPAKEEVAFADQIYQKDAVLDPSLHDIPADHDHVEAYAYWDNWPKRGPEFDKLRSVIKLVVEISHDEGKTFTERFAARAWGDEPPAHILHGLPPRMGFAFAIKGFKTEGRKARVFLECAETLKTQVKLTTSYRDAKFFPEEQPHSVAFGAAGSGVTFTNVSTVSFTINNSGSNRLLLVGVGYVMSTVGTTGSFTHNGNALSQVIANVIAFDGVANSGRSAIHSLVAPDVGSQVVAGTFTNGGNYGHVNGVIYTGVDQSTPLGTPNAADEIGDTTPGVDIDISSGNMGFAAMAYNGPSASVTPGKTDRTKGAGFDGQYYWGSVQDTADTGTPVTLGWTVGAAFNTATVGVEIIAATGGGAQNIDIGQANETDTAQTFTHLKSKTLGLNTETDLAQALTRLKLKTLGLNTETDIAQAIAHALSRTLGQTSETDTAGAITASGDKNISVAQVEETDQALTITWSPKIRQLAQAEETDTAFAIARLKLLVINQVMETDSTTAMGRLKAKTLGLVSETDEAFTITKTGGASGGGSGSGFRVFLDLDSGHIIYGVA